MLKNIKNFNGKVDLLIWIQINKLTFKLIKVKINNIKHMLIKINYFVFKIFSVFESLINISSHS